jgi:hypothetical protein
MLNAKNGSVLGVADFKFHLLIPKSACFKTLKILRTAIFSGERAQHAEVSQAFGRNCFSTWPAWARASTPEDGALPERVRNGNLF